MRFPTCIHPQLEGFVGTAHVDAGTHAHVSMAGTFEGADVDAPFDVSLQTEPVFRLPAWLRALQVSSGALCTGFECDGTTCVRYKVPLEHGALRWTCQMVNFEEWAITIPFLPSIPLESVIGMRPVRLVVKQGDRTYATYVVQRQQHCVELHR